MRALGVDFGEKRIGLAVSDESGEVVVAVGVVRRRSDAQAASEVASAALERGVERVVVGLPLHSGPGGESPFAARARSFAKKLASLSGLPVDLHSEELTSVSAAATLRSAGLFPDRDSGTLDAEAAAELLRDWLSARRARGVP